MNSNMTSDILIAANKAKKEQIQATVDKIFKHHEVDRTKVCALNGVRGRTKETAKFILSVCPDSPERNIAITKLQEAMFWANASIAKGSGI